MNIDIGLQSILKTHLDLAGALVPVRFSLAAPDAQSVQLMGEMTQWRHAPIAMQKDEQGIWQTSLRLAQGQWLYKFIVDGAFIADPCNPQRADDGLGGHHSCLLVGAGDWSEQRCSPRGDVLPFEFTSRTLGGSARGQLYLPPAYDPARSYPLLYLLHGYRTEINQWAGNGLIGNFMDNLLAQSLIDPFVIVMPAPCTLAQAGAFDDFLCGELHAWLQQHYAIAPERRHIAVAGMSQFSINAFKLAKENPQRFGFAAPVSAFYPQQFLDVLDEETLRLDCVLRLYCGMEDYACAGNERLAAILRKNGARFDYLRVAGDHSWHYWNSITRDLLIAASDFFAAAHVGGRAHDG